MHIFDMHASKGVSDMLLTYDCIRLCEIEILKLRQILEEQFVLLNENKAI